MVTTILFGMVFALSLILSTIVGYYYGVKNVMYSYSRLNKAYTKEFSKLDEIERKAGYGEDKLSN